MSEAFLKVVNMSISAGWLILAVLALRLILKKAPKWVNVLLWGIVAVRLICPFSIESAMSLIPSAETISPEIMMDPTPGITTGIPSLNSAINPIISGSFAPNPGDSANPLQILIPIASFIWILGVLLMLLYTIGSYVSLRLQLRIATRLRENIYQCVTVDSPFVLGIFQPKIYLPYEMEGEDLNHVVAHEEAHIRRKDHWWKPLGFLLLTIHWFNPLMWVAYILLCRDIELACDEKVIAELGNAQRADYTEALVACSVNRRMIAACPLAFGEVSVKERVKNVMNYKKPGFWIIVIAVVVCIVFAVCFLTDPTGFKFNESASIVSAAYFDFRGAMEGSAELNPAQISELASRLSGVKNTRKSDQYAGFTPGYQISAMLQDGSYIRISGYSLSSNEKVDIEWNGSRYVVSDAEFQDYLSRVCASDDTTRALGSFLVNQPYGVVRVTYESPYHNFSMVAQENTPEYFIDENLHLYSVKEHSEYPDWTDLGELTEFSITKENFDDLFSNRGDGWYIRESASAIRKNTEKAWTVIYDQDKLYYILQQKNGELYLAYGYYDYSEKDDPGSDDTSIRWLYLLAWQSNEKPTLSLNDVIILSQKENELTWSDFEGFSYSDIGSGLFIWDFEINERFHLRVIGGSTNVAPTSIRLGANDGSESWIDIREGGVTEFVQAHNGDNPISTDVVMVPTDTKLEGLHAGALLLPIDGNIYRYLLTDNTADGITADKLLFEFTEPDLNRTIDWEVYSLKGYPDLSVVMMLSKNHGAWLCTYSPPGRCSDSALEDAIQAGYVIIEDGIATHGQNKWKTFYEDTQKGKAASVVVARYQTLDPQRCDIAYFEAFNQDYPNLNIYYLSYDGNTYTLSFVDGGVQYTRTYEYIMRYETDTLSVMSSKVPQKTTRYILTHDNQVTWEELFGGMYSSQLGAYIDHYSIYAERKN